MPPSPPGRPRPSASSRSCSSPASCLSSTWSSPSRPWPKDLQRAPAGEEALCRLPPARRHPALLHRPPRRPPLRRSRRRLLRRRRRGRLRGASERVFLFAQRDDWAKLDPKPALIELAATPTNARVICCSPIGPELQGVALVQAEVSPLSKPSAKKQIDGISGDGIRHLAADDAEIAAGVKHRTQVLRCAPRGRSPSRRARRRSAAKSRCRPRSPACGYRVRAARRIGRRSPISDLGRRRRTRRRRCRRR